MLPTHKNQPSSCTDDHDPNLLSIEQARQRIKEMLTPINAYEQIHIRQALSRILYQTVNSTIDVPSYTNSAMDGYAIRFEDIDANPTIALKVIGKSFAGNNFSGTVNANQAVRIMTGASIPHGADTVIMQEHVELENDCIRVQQQYSKGQNIRQRGEDLTVGESALSEGRLLMSPDIGLLASMGIAEVKVTRKLRVAFFSTGDELQNVGEVLEDGQIYDSNRYTLYSMLTQLGCEIIDMGIIKDQPDLIENAFKSAAQHADVLITSGGVSVGEADYVKVTLEKLGKVNFWKLAMKPGRPLAVGKLDSCYFFGLPGNPVSAIVTFYQLVQPALRFLTGQAEAKNTILRVRSVSSLKKRRGRVEFQRGTLFHTENGELVVKTTGNQGSHVLSSLSKANCFIVLEEDCGNVEENTMVNVQTFENLNLL